jgi:hypothetical protein
MDCSALPELVMNWGSAEANANNGSRFRPRGSPIARPAGRAAGGPLWQMQWHRAAHDGVWGGMRSADPSANLH